MSECSSQGFPKWPCGVSRAECHPVAALWGRSSGCQHMTAPIPAVPTAGFPHLCQSHPICQRSIPLKRDRTSPSWAGVWLGIAPGHLNLTPMEGPWRRGGVTPMAAQLCAHRVPSQPWFGLDTEGQPLGHETGSRYQQNTQVSIPKTAETAAPAARRLTLSSVRGARQAAQAHRSRPCQTRGSRPRRHGQSAAICSLAHGTWVGACATAR